MTKLSRTAGQREIDRRCAPCRAMSSHVGRTVEAICRRVALESHLATRRDSMHSEALTPHRTPPNTTPAGFNRSCRNAHNHRYVNYGRLTQVLVRNYSRPPLSPALARRRPTNLRRTRPTRATTPQLRGVDRYDVASLRRATEYASPVPPAITVIHAMKLNTTGMPATGLMLIQNNR